LADAAPTLLSEALATSSPGAQAGSGATQQSASAVAALGQNATHGGEAQASSIAADAGGGLGASAPESASAAPPTLPTAAGALSAGRGALSTDAESGGLDDETLAALALFSDVLPTASLQGFAQYSGEAQATGNAASSACLSAFDGASRQALADEGASESVPGFAAASVNGVEAQLLAAVALCSDALPSDLRDAQAGGQSAATLLHVHAAPRLAPASADVAAPHPASAGLISETQPASGGTPLPAAAADTYVLFIDDLAIPRQDNPEELRSSSLEHITQAPDDAAPRSSAALKCMCCADVLWFVLAALLLCLWLSLLLLSAR
jgi:hypothetical protein